MMRRPTGMRAFTLVWVGQVLSLLGTGMTRFALGVWAYELTGEATALALVAFFSMAPLMLVSPLAGVLVDRWNRKWVMMLSDVLAGVMTILILIFYSAGNLQIWHLYLLSAVAGVGEAFQWPAYSAAISTMLRKEQYARADGMLGLAGAASEILAPFLAGTLLAVIGLNGILLFDIVTFLIAVGTLLAVTIPPPVETEHGREGRGSVWREAAYGFRYIFQRPSLAGLLLVFLAANFVFNLAFVPLTPMILARTGGDEQLLGLVLSVGAIGGTAGGLYMSLTGGPKRKIHGFLIPQFVAGVVAMVLGIARLPLIWAAAIFIETTGSPIMMGAQQAIWQTKVAPDVQGRVFATRRLLGQVSAPVALLLVGPLADQVFEPAMQPGGALAPVFGGLVGVGPGAGMALMMVLFGFAGIFTGVAGYAFRAVRDAEDLLPDHEQAEVESGTALSPQTVP